MSGFDFNDTSMLELFKIEVEAQVKVLSEGLLELENDPSNKSNIEPLMRAAHSLKGAARIIQLDGLVKLGHIMEDCFVAVQNNQIELNSKRVDILFKGVDVFSNIQTLDVNKIGEWLSSSEELINQTSELIATVLTPETEKAETKSVEAPVKEEAKPVKSKVREAKPTKIEKEEKKTNENEKDRALRVSASILNKMLGLSGEVYIQAQQLFPLVDSLQKIKFTQSTVSKLVDQIVEAFRENKSHEYINSLILQTQEKLSSLNNLFSNKISELETFTLGNVNITNTLYREVLSSKMRPINELTQDFPRMVRDLAKQLGKKIKFEIKGKNTKVDRDILEKLKAPLTHLLRNSVDHGIEFPEDRIKAGKPQEGVITLEAYHRAGMLFITVSDDGKGVDYEKLKEIIIARNLASKEMVNQLNHKELLDFLFLPGFSTAGTVTEVSGRGVGLDAVHSMISEVSGTVQASSETGKGITFNLQLPVTLSVIRALLVKISEDLYAFPLTRIEKTMLLNKNEIKSHEGREYFDYNNINVALIPSYQVLELPSPKETGDSIPIILVNEHASYYGIAVDSFVEERDLVIKPLDSRLGKLQDISSTSLLEDGTPVLIIDVEDLVRSIENMLPGGRIKKIGSESVTIDARKKKKILVVDDSLTVREVERKLLENAGYFVEVAVNGIDGWNAVRAGEYDLIITDIDMPRMNGIELVTLIKADAKLKNLPAMIVSYKDREEDRIQGLEAGANYYLTKSSFHDETLLNAVKDLIGDA